MIMRAMTQPPQSSTAHRTMTVRRVSFVLVTTLMLSACSHKPLKAPCDLNEGKPAAVMAIVQASLLPDSVVALLVDTGPCGLLRRLGQD